MDLLDILFCSLGDGIGQQILRDPNLMGKLSKVNPVLLKIG